MVGRPEPQAGFLLPVGYGVCVAPEHYFTRDPAGDGTRHPWSLELAGRSVRVVTAGGVFSPRRLDPGTRVLLENAPAPPRHGDLLDLGCGWGPLALTLGLLAPEATVWAIDVNERALELTRENAGALGLRRVHAVRPDSVPEGVRFAALWSNPPIRVGKEALHGMLSRWLPRLAPEGEAWLVAHKNLGADSLQRWLESECALPAERVATQKGYRLLRVTGRQAGALTTGADDR